MNIKRVLLTALGVLLGFVLLLVIWGLIEPRAILATERLTVGVPGLDSAWAGRRVAFLSDWQLGPWWANEGMAERAMEAAIAAEPEVILLGGDFIAGTGDDLDDGLRAAARIAALGPAAGIPTYAVLGNHDWGLAQDRTGDLDPRLAAEVHAALSRAGVRVLENESVPLAPAGGGAMHLVAIGSEWANRARPEAALRGVPANAPRFVLMHNPTSFREIPAGAAPVAVAGHTHGGQIRVPSTPSWSWLQWVGRDVPVDGWAREGYGAPGNRLFVSRGIGMSAVPIRINCAPQLVIFTLAPAARD